METSSPSTDLGVHNPEQGASSLDLFLSPLSYLLNDSDVTDICINKPGEIFVERYTGWSSEHQEFLTFEWCMLLAKLIAHHTKQHISPKKPRLAGMLPGGERVQISIPPVTANGTVSITIRRGATDLWSLTDLSNKGVFDHVKIISTISNSKLPGLFRGKNYRQLDDEDKMLLTLLEKKDFVGFFTQAVILRKNIILSGATSSGKTLISKALILEIPPNERIITIEDVFELIIREQKNNVRFIYSQGDQGISNTNVGDLLVDAKRQRPDRILVSELRTGDEVYNYLIAINSGHPGSITSTHANSANEAFTGLAQMMKNGSAGKSMSTQECIELIQSNLDIVIQCKFDSLARKRFVSEIWFNPHVKRKNII